MKNILQLVAIVLMYRICWQKLFIVLAMTTTAVMVLQTYTLPYPMATWFLSPQLPVSSNKSLNGSPLHLTKSLSLESSEQFQLVPTAPVVYLNSSPELVHSAPITEDRAQDFLELVQSVPITEDRAQVSPELVQSVPITEDRAQVSSRRNPSSRGRRKNRKTVKIEQEAVFLPPPPPRIPPTRLQVEQLAI